MLPCIVPIGTKGTDENKAPQERTEKSEIERYFVCANLNYQL